jgi:GntR family transcriptional regulator of abcA and norABC
MSFIRIFSRHEARVATIPTLNNQQNNYYSEHFSEVLRRNYAKFFLIRPTYLNPTGRTLDHQTRQSILDNTYKFKVPLVEYDPYYDLYHDRPAPDPIISMDSKDYVLYIGSFPRSLPLDMQLGWIAGPRTVISRIARLKRMDRDYTNSILQWIADDFCRTGNMERYLHEVRKQCRQNCQAFADTIKKYGQNLIRCIPPPGGYHVWCALPESVNAEQLLAVANYHKVVFMPGDMFFLSGNLGENHIRLTLFDMTEEEVIEGTRRLCQAVREVVEA